MKASTRKKVAAVFLKLVPTLCACRRPIPPQLPEEIRKLVDEARAALAARAREPYRLHEHRQIIMRFHKRINENLHVFGDKIDNGEWRISVVDAVSRPIENARTRARAIKLALADQSALRSALWAELPPEAQDEVRRRS